VVCFNSMIRIRPWLNTAALWLYRPHFQRAENFSVAHAVRLCPHSRAAFLLAAVTVC